MATIAQSVGSPDAAPRFFDRCIHEAKRHKDYRGGEKGALLGEGSYGVVSCVADTDVAVKDCVGSKEGLVSPSAIRELMASRWVGGIQCSVKIYQTVVDEITGTTSIFMQRESMDLSVWRSKVTDIPTVGTVINLGLQVALFLEQLHASGFVHCDIRAKNILVNELMEVRVADFGMVRRCVEGVDPYDVMCESTEPPDREVGRAVDSWGLGCLIVHLILGGMPWGKEITKETFATSELFHTIVSGVAPGIRDGIRGLLHPEGAKRITPRRFIELVTGKPRPRRPCATGWSSADRAAPMDWPYVGVAWSMMETLCAKFDLKRVSDRAACMYIVLSAIGDAEAVDILPYFYGADMAGLASSVVTVLKRNVLSCI